MEMECRTIGGSIVQHWTVETNSIKGKQKIFVNKEAYKANAQLSLDVLRFGIDVDQNGSGVLYLNSTTFDDAGIYTCRVQDKNRTLYYSGKLVVLGKIHSFISNIYINDSQPVGRGPLPGGPRPKLEIENFLCESRATPMKKYQ